MAVALGLSPREVEAIADESPKLYEALVAAARERWSPTDELLAGILELSHANYRIALQMGGVKKHELPEPLKVPRPYERTETKNTKKKVSPSDFAGWIKGRTGGG